MPKPGEGCVTPAKGVVAPAGEKSDAPDVAPDMKKEAFVDVMVGRPAPDFEANALVGMDFKQIKLSDYRGKWVVLCFYPGDFTFV
jgi:hypothetical protein